MSVRFKRAEIVQFLASDRVFGDAVALQVDMDFVKNPKSNLDAMLQCFLSGLEKLGYKIENLHQPPAQAALSVSLFLVKLFIIVSSQLNQATFQLFDDEYWVKRNVRTRLNHLFKRYSSNIVVTLSDILDPTPSRFALIISNMINICFHRNIVMERMAEIDENIADKRSENRQKERELEKLRDQVDKLIPNHESMKEEIAKIKLENQQLTTSTNETMTEVKIEQERLAKKTEKKAAIEQQVDIAEVRLHSFNVHSCSISAWSRNVPEGKVSAWRISCNWSRRVASNFESAKRRCRILQGYNKHSQVWSNSEVIFFTNNLM